MINRTKIIDYLKGFDYYNIRRIYADYKEREQKYDDEIMELLRNYPLLCFEFEVLTDLEIITNAKSQYICYIPPGIKRFTKLKQLALTFNSLSTLPNEFECLVNLESIDLEKNKFINFPLVLTKLPKLKSINFQRNNLVEIPKEIENLNHIEWLSLSGNNLKSLPDSISQLKKLQYISLDGNPISKQEMEKIKNLLPEITQIIF